MKPAARKLNTSTVRYRTNGAWLSCSVTQNGSFAGNVQPCVTPKFEEGMRVEFREGALRGGANKDTLATILKIVSVESSAAGDGKSELWAFAVTHADDRRVAFRVADINRVFEAVEDVSAIQLEPDEALQTVTRAVQKAEKAHQEILARASAVRSSMSSAAARSAAVVRTGPEELELQVPAATPAEAQVQKEETQARDAAAQEVARSMGQTPQTPQIPQETIPASRFTYAELEDLIASVRVAISEMHGANFGQRARQLLGKLKNLREAQKDPNPTAPVAVMAPVPNGAEAAEPAVQ